MNRLAASLILVALTLGQGLSWVCVGSAGQASPTSVELVAGEVSGSHHASGHGSGDDSGRDSQHDSGHDSHHDSQADGCDAMMACGMAGATVAPVPALEAFVAGRRAALESDLLLQAGPPAQDPPPPRLG